MTEPRVRFGLEAWLTGGDIAAAGRLAYVGTRASVAADGRTPGLSLLRNAGARVAAIWAPEHGYAADAPAGAPVADAPTAGEIPISSLYGTRAAPDARMLDAIDTIVFDLQDVGARYYTFWHVLKQCLRAATAAHKQIIVCDRPNPLGAARWGNVLPADCDAPVGCWPLPMQHGLTTGDIATGWQRAHPDVRVTRACMSGWRRTQAWTDLNLPWTPPSPNLPDLESVAAYPGTCLGEGLTLSVGRGTPWPFRWLGAPWLQAEAVADAVNVLEGGWHADPDGCVPESESFLGEHCNGVRLTRTRPDADPLPPVLTVFATALQRHPECCRFHASHFDALAGGPQLREGLLAGHPAPTLMDTWAADRAAAPLQPTDAYG